MLFRLRKNQPKLYWAVSNAFKAVFDAHKEKVVTHIKQEIDGRKEERYVYQLKANLPTELAQKRPTIRSIIAVERHKTINNRCSIDTSYYISSMSPKHKMLGHHIRQYWRIENSQLYVLGVVFKGDESRIALEGAVESLALFRRFVINILRQCEFGAPNQRRKIKKASWSDDYQARIFFGF